MAAKTPHVAVRPSDAVEVDRQRCRHYSDGRHQLIELRLGNYHVHGARISWGRSGATFGFSIGPLADATVAALRGVAERRGTIRLYCRPPLLLDLLEVENEEPQRVRIVGRIVPGIADAMGREASDLD